MKQQYTWDELDELVDTDPIALRNLAVEFAKEAGRFKAPAIRLIPAPRTEEDFDW